MVKKPDRNKAKDEWMGRAPEPDVLVKDVECCYSETSRIRFMN